MVAAVYNNDRRVKRLLIVFIGIFVILVSVVAISAYHDELLMKSLFVALVVALVAAAVVFDFRETKRDRELANLVKTLTNYRNLVDESAYVSVADKNGLITYVNDRFCERCGYTKEEIIGQTHAIVRHPDTPKEYHRDMWRTILEGKIWRGVVKNRSKMGQTYYVDSTIVPVLDSTDEVVEFMTLRYDVTVLQNALVVAREAQDVKDNFLATMSHEIRTPLNAILGFVDLLGERIKDPELVRYLETIGRSGQTLLSIINDILDFAKIESGKLEIEKNPCNLRNDIASTIALFSVNAESKNIQLSESWSDNFPECLVTDQMRVRQIISNLLSNAIKFTPNGKRVVLYAIYKEQESKVEFLVEDEGIGISVPWQKKIFDAFSQVRSTDASRHGGTGLGLSISMNLASMLGGTLSVSSEEGVGSTFCLSLPAVIGQNKADHSSSHAAHSNGGNRRILVAEDQMDNQLLIRLLLERLGFAVTITADGKEAVEKFVSGGAFDLVLLDENMPVMTGTQALVQIRDWEERHTSKRTPVVVLTANAIMGDRDRFIRAGFDDYLSKPIVKKELVSVLMRLLDSDD